MAQLKVYGAAASRSFRTLWMAGELDIEFDHIPVNFRGGGNLKPEYLAVNPSGQMPTISDNGFILRESLAINLYLAKKYALGRLYPADLQGEALIWQWSFFAATQVEVPIRAWPANTPLPPAANFPRDPHNSDSLAVLARSMELLNSTLAASPYLVGADFSVADLNLAGILSRTAGNDYGAATHVADWLRRCLARPAAVTALRQRKEAGG
jgi:glutathione S-transferase